jgi:hypothetical protein
MMKAHAYDMNIRAQLSEGDNQRLENISSPDMHGQFEYYTFTLFSEKAVLLSIVQKRFRQTVIFPATSDLNVVFVHQSDRGVFVNQPLNIFAVMKSFYHGAFVHNSE